jgi:hypothetical protein
LIFAAFSKSARAIARRHFLSSILLVTFSEGDVSAGDRG